MSIEKRIKEQQEREERNAIRDGKHYRTRFNAHAPYYRGTLEEAEAQRDEIIRRFGRQLTATEFLASPPPRPEDVWIEHYEGGRWQHVEGSRRQVERGSGDSQEP